MSKTEHIHIQRRTKTNDFECNYNDVVAHGDTAVNAYKNAKRKYQLKEDSETLELIGAGFKKTLENVRV